MQVVETRNEGLSREFTVTLEAQEIATRIDAKLAEIAKTAQMPGFRPGKVPVKILRQRYETAVLGEILEAAVQDSSANTLKERSLKPAMQPKIEISSFEKESDLVYTMAVEILPEIEVMDLATLSVTLYKPDITDGEVDEAVEGLAKANRSTEKIEEDRKTAEGDVVILDFKGFVDGEAFEGGEATDFRLELGSSQFIPGFEDQLTGHKANENITVKVTFPEAYGAEHLAGKDATFECTINEIHAYVDRTIDDEFAKEFGVETLEELRNTMRTRIEGDYSGMARARTKRELLDILHEKHSFDLPQGMVDSEFEQIWKQFEEARERDEIDDDDKEKDDETLKSDYHDIAKRRVLLGLLLTHVGEQAKVEVSEEDMRRALFDRARQFPGQERQFVEAFSKNPELMASLRAPIFEEKTVDYILELADTTELRLPVDKLLEDGDESAAEDDKATKKSKAKKSSKKSASKKAAAKKAEAKTAD